MKWLFWKVPTDGMLETSKTSLLFIFANSPYKAEWAIARLQVEAAHRTEALRQVDPTPRAEEKHVGSAPDDSGDDQEQEISLGQFHCTSQNHHGDLCVTPKGVKYKTAIRSHILWQLRFDDLTTLQKVGTGEGLLFVSSSGEGYRVSGLKSRNEVFTQIVGYSGLHWQVTG